MYNGIGSCNRVSWYCGKLVYMGVYIVVYFKGRNNKCDRVNNYSNQAILTWYPSTLNAIVTITICGLLNHGLFRQMILICVIVISVYFTRPIKAGNYIII